VDMKKHSKIYVAGNTGLVGSAIVRKLKAEGYSNLVFTPFPQYDLANQQQIDDFFDKEKPEYVFLAAAKLSGIMANSIYVADNKAKGSLRFYTGNRRNAYGARICRPCL